MGLPLFRVGFPMFDRLGAVYQRTVGYKGSRDLIFAVGNLLMEHSHDVETDGLGPVDTGLPGGGGHAPVSTH